VKEQLNGDDDDLTVAIVEGCRSIPASYAEMHARDTCDVPESIMKS
jgi:hypothetical protein